MATKLFEEDGALRDSERLAPAVRLTLDRLLWWARALRQARHDAPYEV